MSDALLLTRLVQRFRRDVSAIGPGNRSAIDEELLEVTPILQRFEDGSVQPILKVHGAFSTVDERQVDPKAASYFARITEGKTFMITR